MYQKTNVLLSLCKENAGVLISLFMHGRDLVSGAEVASTRTYARFEVAGHLSYQIHLSNSAARCIVSRAPQVA